eukprot:gene5367-5602_t
MGFSHEWPYVEELHTIPQYTSIIKMLQSYGSGPLVLRIGGGSTDKLTTVPGQDVWHALSELHKDVGMLYIVGLNFLKNDHDLAREQMDAAIKGLPKGSIMSFEIGNEPDYYFNVTCTHWNGTTVFVSFDDYIRSCYHTDWYNMAQALSCRNGPSSCIDGLFTGPVWGHLNLRNTTMDWFIKTSGRWLNMTSVHWYKATSETINTPVTLLDEAPIRKEMINLAEIVRVSNSYGKPLRVAEMNTISNSGRPGVSNVMAAALWTLDGSFEVAQAGAVGVNFHQGAGQNLYAAVIRYYDSSGKLAPPLIKPPFYGMLMFQQAVGSSTRLLGHDTVWRSTNDASNFIKVWSLQDLKSGHIRWVVLNKDPSRPGTAVLRLNRKSGYSSEAQVTRLLASGPDPLSATTGISLGGIIYADGGVRQGSAKTEKVLSDLASDGNIRLTVSMPPGSAAIVQLPKQ